MPDGRVERQLGGFLRLEEAVTAGYHASLCGFQRAFDSSQLQGRPMPTNPKQIAVANRRRFLGCAAGALALGAAPIREEPEEIIPLKTVVTTSGQEDLLEVPWGRILKDEDLGRLVDPRKVGPANLFLVVGKDFDTAMDATCGAFFEGISVNRPVVRPGDKRSEEDRFWAFVYLGAAQTSPSEWTVTRASLQRDQVRLMVTRPSPEKRFRVNDYRVYMFWVPLGVRNEKTFTLAVYDETNRVMIMTRHVVLATS